MKSINNPKKLKMRKKIDIWINNWFVEVNSKIYLFLKKSLFSNKLGLEIKAISGKIENIPSREIIEATAELIENNIKPLWLYLIIVWI